MIYFLKPTAEFADLDESNIELVDSNNQPITGVQIERPDGEDRRLYLTKDNWSQQIKRDAYIIAYESKQVLKMDTNQTKCRIVPSVESFNQKYKAKINRLVNDKSEFVKIEDLNIQTSKLKDIDFDPELFIPLKTNTDLDTFLSWDGGIMPGTNTLVTGDPGVGKSSNLMDILCNLQKSNKKLKTLYISAEMNQLEVKKFEKWYPKLKDIDFIYLADYVIEDKGCTAYQALQSVLQQGWNVVIMDSLVEVLSMCSEDLGLSTPKAERWLLNLLNTHNKGNNKLNLFTSFLCIQQKNKSGQYVGSKRLEHMTSAFLQLKWDEKEKGKRYMMFSKNRNGKENIRLYYNFKDGIQYDIKKYKNELELIKSSTNFNSDDLEEMDINTFFSQLKEKSGLELVQE